MSDGERRVAAQRHLDGRREPAKPERRNHGRGRAGATGAVRVERYVGQRRQEGGLREVHLGGDQEHLAVRQLAARGDQAHGRWVASERAARERVHHEDVGMVVVALVLVLLGAAMVMVVVMVMMVVVVAVLVLMLLLVLGRLVVGHRARAARVATADRQRAE